MDARTKDALEVVEGWLTSVANTALARDVSEDGASDSWRRGVMEAYATQAKFSLGMLKVAYGSGYVQFVALEGKPTVDLERDALGDSRR